MKVLVLLVRNRPTSYSEAMNRSDDKAGRLAIPDWLDALSLEAPPLINKAQNTLRRLRRSHPEQFRAAFRGDEDSVLTLRQMAALKRGFLAVAARRPVEVECLLEIQSGYEIRHDLLFCLERYRKLCGPKVTRDAEILTAQLYSLEELIDEHVKELTLAKFTRDVNKSGVRALTPEP